MCRSVEHYSVVVMVIAWVYTGIVCEAVVAKGRMPSVVAVLA